MSTQRRQITAAIAALTLLLLTGCAKAPAPAAQPAAPASAPTNPGTATTPVPAPVGTNPSTPVTNPPPPAEEADVAIRKTLGGYLDALNRGAFPEAASYWSPASSVTPPSGANLKIAGVEGYQLQASEIIKSDERSAYVQLTFEVKVTGQSTGYENGRNIRYVHLSKLDGAWKIASWSKFAEM